jgi:serine/threonine protein kinase
MRWADELVAVKTVKAADERTLVQFLLEARLLAIMSHTNIVRLLAVQESTLPLMMVMEYCAEGDLRQLLRSERLGVLVTCEEEAAVCDMSRQVASAVAYLHTHLCVHRDLAARNVLVCRAAALSGCGLLLKLADVGLSRVLRSEQDYYRATADSDAIPVRWQCPSAVRTGVYSTRSDVYSFGVLVWEICAHGATPYAELSVSEVLRFVANGQRLSRPSPSTPDGVMGLIWDCTQSSVAQRPAMREVLSWLEKAVGSAEVRAARVERWAEGRDVSPAGATTEEGQDGQEVQEEESEL